MRDEVSVVISLSMALGMIFLVVVHAWLRVL